MDTDITLVHHHVEGIIWGWLAEHMNDSERTADTYAGFLVGWKYTRNKQWDIKITQQATCFRTFAKGSSADLLDDPKTIAYLAQAWAALPNSRTGQMVSASTHNLRLAALSSFYEYAIRHDEYIGLNPLARVKRMKRELYSGANPLAFLDGELLSALDAIPTKTHNQLRDKAMLYLALYTGRRLSEISNLRCSNIQPFKAIWYIHWLRTKGGKSAKNELRVEDCPAIPLLEKWLNGYYGKKWPSDAYVFPSLARGHEGQQMTPQGMEQRCKLWLNTSKFHQLRHTFSAMFLEAEGTVQDLSALLGHSSIGVTGTYIPKLTGGKNKVIKKMGDVMAGKKP